MPASTNVETIRDWIGLSVVHGVGPKLFYHLVNRFGSPTEVLNAPSSVVNEIPGLRPGYLVELSDAGRLRKRADRELSELDKIGARALIRDESDYPELLRHIGQPPPVIYGRGISSLLQMNSVAVVGSRAATTYGRRVSRTLARDLALAGLCVVSGLALGIDAEAHAGALDAEGATVGVLGCGLDVVYPRGNQRLSERIKESGLLISEYPLGTRPEGYRFPARNRIIAGLSRAVVVVEASKKSGSLITVQFGLEQGRDIFAVPGQVDSIKSAGTHWLVQQGASLAVSAADIMEQLAIDTGYSNSRTEGHNDPQPNLEPELAALWSLVEPYPQPRETLLQRSGLLPAQFNEALLLLELEGLVGTAPGDRIRKLTDGGQ
ncbi:MAG: DNA-processing protein DprA [Desulfocapsaceae bacterium]